MTPQEMHGEVLMEAYSDHRFMPLLAHHLDQRYRLIASSLMASFEERDRHALLHEASAEARTAVAACLAEWTRPRTFADLRAVTNGRGVAPCSPNRCHGSSRRPSIH